VCFWFFFFFVSFLECAMSTYDYSFFFSIFFSSLSPIPHHTTHVWVCAALGVLAGRCEPAALRREPFVEREEHVRHRLAHGAVREQHVLPRPHGAVPRQNIGHALHSRIVRHCETVERE
jgi:hypothetical protein